MPALGDGQRRPRTQRFGEVTSFGAPADGSLDQTFRAKWVSDVSVGYTHNKTLSLIVGADNVWDVYPDRNNNDGPIATNPNTSNGGNSNSCRRKSRIVVMDY